MPTPTNWGTEFLVNTTTGGGQFEPVVTALADGGWVVAWTDGSASGGDTSDLAIRAQRYASDGSALGGEVLVNTTTASSQTQPTVTALADGGWVVAWTDASASGGDTDATAIRAQRFAADGSALDGEVLVNTSTLFNQTTPAVTGLRDGGWVVTWTDFSNSGGDTDIGAIRAQRYGADGTPAGGEVLVNTTTAGAQQSPAIASLADGGWVVAWTDFSQTGGDTESGAIRAQRFGADGTPTGGEMLVNTTTTFFQTDPAVTGLADGGWMVAWRDGSESGGDTSSTAIRAQRYGADGLPDGNEFLVNTITPNSQLEVAVAGLADGRVIAVWEDSSLSPDDPSGLAIRAQLLEPRDAGGVTVAGSAGDDWYIGSDFADALGGAGNDDLLQGRGGDDSLDGGAGNDRLLGGTGADTMVGGSGDDHFVVDDAGDIVIEAAGEGTDTVASRNRDLDLDDFAEVEGARLLGTADLNASGGAGNDLLIGNAGANTLQGGAGNDRLRGEAGADRLVGGTGADLMAGGTGADAFVLAAGDAGTGAAQRDTVLDFARGTDVLDLTALGLTFRTGGFSGSAAEVNLLALGSGTLVRIDSDGDGTRDMDVLVLGVTLEAGDLLL